MKKIENEERDILRTFEKGEWRSVKSSGIQKKRYQGYARAALKKDKRINIRISARDLEGVQRKAMEEGIPYQTLMSSVIHKFVSGKK